MLHKTLTLGIAALACTLFTAQTAQAEELNWAGCGISKKAFMSEMAKVYEEEKGVKINLQGGGATKGIRNTADGSTDIGGSCRHAIPTPAEKGVKMTPIAWDALVVITHPENPVNNITHEDLKKVFSGEIKNWKELGGNDAAIEVFARKGKISGVGLVSRELIFGNTDIDFAATEEFKSTGPLEKKLEQSPNAIALDGISSARKRNLKFLSLNGVEPSKENIISGEYILFRPLYVVTAKKASDKVKEFLKFAKSSKGQEVISSQGTVTLAEGKSLWKKYVKNMATVTGENKSLFEE